MGFTERYLSVGILKVISKIVMSILLDLLVKK